MPNFFKDDFFSILEDPHLHQSGEFHTQSDTLLRVLYYQNVTYWEDGINGYRFPYNGRCDSSVSDMDLVESLSADPSVPFRWLHPRTMPINCLHTVDGHIVKKSHVNPNYFLVVSPNNLVFSAKHNDLQVMDYRRKRDFDTELQNPSLNIGTKSALYIHSTDSLIYDPKPIIAYEPDLIIKEERYTFISELFPIAQLWLSLHSEDSEVLSRINRYNAQSYTLEALTVLGDLITTQQIKHITSWITDIANAPDYICEADPNLLVDAMIGCAKHIESNDKHFNNWVNGIVKREYPFLIFKEPNHEENKT